MDLVHRLAQIKIKYIRTQMEITSETFPLLCTRLKMTSFQEKKISP